LSDLGGEKTVKYTHTWWKWRQSWGR